MDKSKIIRYTMQYFSVKSHRVKVRFLYRLRVNMYKKKIIYYVKVSLSRPYFKIITNMCVVQRQLQERNPKTAQRRLSDHDYDDDDDALRLAK